VATPMLITDEDGNTNIENAFEKTIELETYNTTMEGTKRDRSNISVPIRKQLNSRNDMS
jgi:hypothetical protein